MYPRLMTCTKARIIASPPAFLSTLLLDMTRAESAETFVGCTGVAFFVGCTGVTFFVGCTGVAFFVGALAEELEAIDRNARAKLLAIHTAEQEE